MTFISAQLPRANSVAASSSSAHSQQRLCVGLGQDPKEGEGPQGVSEVLSVAHWAHPTRSAGSRLQRSDPPRPEEAAVGGQVSSTSLGLAGAPSPLSGMLVGERPCASNSRGCFSPSPRSIQAVPGWGAGARGLGSVRSCCKRRRR